MERSQSSKCKTVATGRKEDHARRLGKGYKGLEVALALYFKLGRDT